MRLRWSIPGIAAFASACILGACNAIVGNDDVTLDLPDATASDAAPDGASDAARDAAPGMDGNVPADGAARDAAPFDAGSCDAEAGTGCDTELGLQCFQGQCVGPCATAGAQGGSVGCEFYAATLANTPLAQDLFGFAVVVVNTTSDVAHVIVRGGALAADMKLDVGGGAEQTIRLPWVPALSRTSAQDAPSGTSVVRAGAYQIKSTQPLAVYQFNPLDYVSAGPPDGGACPIGGPPPCYSYTNDSSLLLQVPALGARYGALSWPTFRSGGNGFDCSSSTSTYSLPGTIAVVATSDGTTVTLAANDAIQPGDPDAGVPLGTTGGTVLLNRGDVLQVSTPLDATQPCTFGSNLSGSLVSADKPVEVFGGHDCALVPASIPACDHLEEVLLPWEAAGTDYVVPMPTPMAQRPAQYVTIAAMQDGTALTFDPPDVLPSPPVLFGRGRVTFEATKSFRVQATHPIVVGQFLEGQGAMPASMLGDPSQSTVIPTSAFASSYTFLAPVVYKQNWVSIVAPNGANVTVDGVVVGGYTAVGGSGYQVASVSLCADNTAGCTGIHRIASSAPVGIQVYGYGSYTSYMYPGGAGALR